MVGCVDARDASLYRSQRRCRPLRAGTSWFYTVLCADGFVAAALALAPSPFKAGAQDVAIIDPPDDGQVDIMVHELDGSVELDAALSVLAAEINTAPCVFVLTS